MTPDWVLPAITAAAGMGGVGVGGWIQQSGVKSQHRREQRARRAERLRAMYAAHVADFLGVPSLIEWGARRDYVEAIERMNAVTDAFSARRAALLVEGIPVEVQNSAGQLQDAFTVWQASVDELGGANLELPREEREGIFDIHRREYRRTVEPLIEALAEAMAKDLRVLDEE